MSSSIGIQKDFFFYNHWPRYERSRAVPIWNDFQIILFGVAVLLIYVFRSPQTEKKSFWIPIEEDIRNIFLQLVFLYSAY
jgi:hypothetical protein